MYVISYMVAINYIVATYLNIFKVSNITEKQIFTFIQLLIKELDVTNGYRIRARKQHL